MNESKFLLLISGVLLLVPGACGLYVGIWHRGDFIRRGVLSDLPLLLSTVGVLLGCFGVQAIGRATSMSWGADGAGKSMRKSQALIGGTLLLVSGLFALLIGVFAAFEVVVTGRHPHPLLILLIVSGGGLGCVGLLSLLWIARQRVTRA